MEPAAKKPNVSSTVEDSSSEEVKVKVISSDGVVILLPLLPFFVDMYDVCRPTDDPLPVPLPASVLRSFQQYYTDREKQDLLLQLATDKNNTLMKILPLTGTKFLLDIFNYALAADFFCLPPSSALTNAVNAIHFKFWNIHSKKLFCLLEELFRSGSIQLPSFIKHSPTDPSPLGIKLMVKAFPHLTVRFTRKLPSKKTLKLLNSSNTCVQSKHSYVFNCELQVAITLSQCVNNFFIDADTMAHFDHFEGSEVLKKFVR